MRSIIITAGGIGKRMGSEIPKQFIPIKGLPILMHTINCFYEYDSSIQIIVTLPSDWQDYWNELCNQYSFSVKHELVEGGNERYHSIKNALLKVKGSYVGVHDGVRPFVSQSTIKLCFDEVVNQDAVIPVIALSESIRKIEDSSSIAIDRSNYRIVQTPQVFKTTKLIEAYKQGYKPHFTDDASIVEASGSNIYLVSGNSENIKITTPLDLRLAELLI